MLNYPEWVQKLYKQRRRFRNDGDRNTSRARGCLPGSGNLKRKML